ncbi:hypothetical protein BKA93DRAFT_543673 [Sparassis latifolia]
MSERTTSNDLLSGRHPAAARSAVRLATIWLAIKHTRSVHRGPAAPWMAIGYITGVGRNGRIVPNGRLLCDVCGPSICSCWSGERKVLDVLRYRSAFARSTLCRIRLHTVAGECILLFQRAERDAVLEVNEVPRISLIASRISVHIPSTIAQPEDVPVSRLNVLPLTS